MVSAATGAAATGVASSAAGLVEGCVCAGSGCWRGASRSFSFSFSPSLERAVAASESRFWAWVDFAPRPFSVWARE